MLNVVHGPFTDLEGAFVARLRALAVEGGPILIAAPSRRLADRLQRLACVEGGLSLLDVHFHTFYSLAAALADESGGPPGLLVGDPVFHDAVVDSLLEGAGALFGGAERPKALASAVRASLRDLTDAGVSALDLAERFGPSLVPAGELARLKALLALSMAYEGRLSELGVLSPSGLTRHAASLCEGSPLLGRFRHALYYGFYDLTGLQLEFFEAVCERVPATLYFPFVKDHPAFRYAHDFFEQKLAAQHPAPAPRAAARPAVEPALDRLFTGEAAAALPEGALELVSASGARDEAWAAAKEILALVEGGFCRFDEIGVIARSLEPYRAAVEEVFAENAIPLDLAAGEPLLRRPVAKLAWTLLSLKRRDFPALAALDILGSPYFAPAPKPRTLALWRAAIERLSIHAGWLQWRKLEARLETGLALDEEGRRQVAPEDVRALWETLSSWQRELSRESATWAELAARARELVASALALPDDASEAETAAFSLVMEQLESLAAFDLLGQAPTWNAFLDALERKLRAASLENGGGSRRGVRVLGAMDARGESFEAVFLLGLKEKSFPRQVQEDPILREPVRAALRHPAGYWTRRKLDGYEEERLLFYLSCASAKRKLVCVYPRSDESGKAEVPSLYLRELCRAAGRDLALARRVPRLPFERLQSAPLSLLCPRETSLRLSWAGGQAGAYGVLVGLPGAQLDACLGRLPELLRGGPPGVLDGMVSPPTAFFARLEEKGLSPSALDTLAACAFRFFGERLLSLGSPDEPTEQGEIASWLRGKVYHAVLERFYAATPSPLDLPDWRPSLQAALDAVFADYGWRELGVYPLLWEAAREQIGARLLEFAEWDVPATKASGLRPLWLEKELEGRMPGGLKVRGIVDRVDADAAKKIARVIDYKSTWKGGKISRLMGDGKHHQLPIYSDLVAEALGIPTVASAEVVSIEDSKETTGRERAQGLCAEDWAHLREGFYAAVTKRVEAAAAGRFPITPSDDRGHCQWCDFPTLCRKSHAPSRARAKTP